ncbi:MAG: hypothetical protein QM493_07420 [Sulfurovum sp.]
MKIIFAFKSIILLGITLLLTGCIPFFAYTPKELRVSSKSDKSEIIVNRSYADVTKTFKKMSPRCLNFNYHLSNGFDNIDSDYSSHITVFPNKTTLYVSRLLNHIPMISTHYVMVVDIYPNGAKSTKLVTSLSDADEFRTLMEDWATGKSVGCMNI